MTAQPVKPLLWGISMVYILGLLVLPSCQGTYYPTVSLSSTEAVEGEALLKKASAFMDEGDLENALVYANHALKAFPAEQRQKAIFQKAVIYGHPDNEKQDLKRALFYFNLTAQGPDENLAAYARFMKKVLQASEAEIIAMETQSKRIKALEKKNTDLINTKGRLEGQNHQFQKKNAALIKQIMDFKNEMELMEEADYSSEPIMEKKLGQ